MRFLVLVLLLSVDSVVRKLSVDVFVITNYCLKTNEA